MSLIASSRRVARLVAVGLLVAAPAVAAPIAYQESVDGDLPSPLITPLKVLALDFGVNTVSGRLGYPGGALDFDSFAFTLPDESALLSGRVELVDVVGNIEGVGWDLRRGSPYWGEGHYVQLVNPESPGFLDLVIRPSQQQGGLYALSMFAIQHSDPKPSADYTFTFDVGPPVPEPGMLILTSIGLAALSLRRQQRR